MAAPNRRRARVIRRRRQTFVRLLAAAGATLVLGVIPHLHSFLILHLALDAGVAFYVTRLRRWRRSERNASARTEAAAAEPITLERPLQQIEMLDYEPDEQIRILLPEADAEPELEYAARRSG